MAKATPSSTSANGPEVRQILDMNAFDAECEEIEDDMLVRRRQANVGAASVLFYQRPIEMVGAKGAWMEAVDGRRYLDFYNNVPSVGHSHPRVVDAISRQITRLNTNTRYLNQNTERYLEALKARLPAPLSNVMLACSGSEANDLAMRVAMKATGASGFVVTETAYHGNTHLVIQASPSSYKKGRPPQFIETVPAPSMIVYGTGIANGFAKDVADAIARLKRRKCGFAGFICDSIFSSDGVFPDPTGFLVSAVEAVHAAGGLYIADEVQPGFARTGETFWGFARHGVEPDIVTMGKPMGNGFPMSGMVTQPELLEAFCEDFGYFNTFGGNPVAAAAGMAVLDVIADEDLMGNACRVGAHLMSRLGELARHQPRIAAVRGAGLFLGVDLSLPDAPDCPDPDLATRVINGLKDRGVLIGAAGKYGHTLKLRPPLCLSENEADFFTDAFGETLTECGRSGN
ncbi:MAG: aspartate aminotransferase family protein [Pseudomonadota bacterium]